MSERLVWVKCLALPQGSEQSVINVKVSDEDSEHEFVLEPEDCLPMEELKALIEAGEGMCNSGIEGLLKSRAIWRAAYKKIREKLG